MMSKKYEVSVPQLCVRYDLQLGLLPLPKTENPEHMASNSELGFVIAEEDMTTLKNIEPVRDYGDASVMTVYGGKLNFKSMISMVMSSRRR